MVSHYWHMRWRKQISEISHWLIHHLFWNKVPFSSLHALYSPKTFILKYRSLTCQNIRLFYLISQEFSTSLDFSSTMPLQGTPFIWFRTWLNGVLQHPGVLLRGSKGIRYLNSSPPSTTLIFLSLKAINLQTYKKLVTKSLPVSKTDLYSTLFRRVLLITHRKMSGLTKIYENDQQDATV